MKMKRHVLPLHHVLRDLQQTKLASEPVNNTPPVEIPPLENHDALEMAKRLLDAERIRFDGDFTAVVQCLVT